MKVLYFASLRATLGQAEEDLELPADVGTAAGLADWLAARGGVWTTAFSPEARRQRALNVAIDQQHQPWDSPLAGATEIAFFPPVTGG